MNNIVENMTEFPKVKWLQVATAYRWGRQTCGKIFVGF